MAKNRATKKVFQKYTIIKKFFLENAKGSKIMQQTSTKLKKKTRLAKLIKFVLQKKNMLIDVKL